MVTVSYLDRINIMMVFYWQYFEDERNKYQDYVSEAFESGKAVQGYIRIKMADVAIDQP